MKYLIAFVALSLAACGSKPEARPEPMIVPQTVNTPIAGACVPDALGGVPAYTDTDEALRAAPDAAERYQLLWAGRSERKARLNELEPIIARCPRGKVE